MAHEQEGVIFSFTFLWQKMLFQPNKNNIVDKIKVGKRPFFFFVSKIRKALLLTSQKQKKNFEQSRRKFLSLFAPQTTLG